MNYQIPSLRDAIAAHFLHQIATGEKLYWAVDREPVDGEYGLGSAYTHVQEINLACHLAVGSFDDSDGSCIDDCGGPRTGFVGVAALRKF